jgi:hypothetical protein
MKEAIDIDPIITHPMLYRVSESSIPMFYKYN